MSALPAEQPIRDPICFEPGRLWSLWDMLKFTARTWFGLGDAIRLIQLTSRPPYRTSEDEDHLREYLDDVADFCMRLQMPVTQALAIKAKESLLETEGEFNLFYEAFNAEIRSRFLLYVAPDRAPFYESDSIISDGAKTAFPSAYPEIREAGTCYALERHTAAVLHAMRAAEVGVKAMARALGYSPENLDQQDWHPVLTKCESLIQEMRDKMQKGPQKEELVSFYSKVAAQFRHFKDGWRVQAAHTRPPFSQVEAKEIVDATISFFDLLATRLSEASGEPQP